MCSSDLDLPWRPVLMEGPPPFPPRRQGSSPRGITTGLHTAAPQTANGNGFLLLYSTPGYGNGVAEGQSNHCRFYRKRLILLYHKKWICQFCRAPKREIFADVLPPLCPNTGINGIFYCYHEKYHRQVDFDDSRMVDDGGQIFRASN